MLSERSPSQKTNNYMILLHELPRTGKCLDRKQVSGELPRAVEGNTGNEQKLLMGMRLPGLVTNVLELGTGDSCATL